MYLDGNERFRVLIYLFIYFLFGLFLCELNTHKDETFTHNKSAFYNLQK